MKLALKKPTEIHHDHAAVRCKNVSRHFGKGAAQVNALVETDFEAPAGELTVLAGPSGCGKTTLISIIAGVLDATSGSVNVHGTYLNKISAAAKTRFRRRNIGMVFQEFNLLPSLTAVENAAIPLLVLGWSRGKAIGEAARWLDRFGMRSRRDAFPFQMSGGEQQRVAIARALIHKPRLIVCDEPTSALDHDTGKEIMNCLRSLVNPERAIVVVTHDQRIFQFADRVTFMEDGKITSH